MERMTNKRCNGIKDGYWSPATKETLVQRLAQYENTDLEPAEIAGLVRETTWRRPSDPPKMWEPVIICREDKDGHRRVEAGSLQEGGWYKIYGTRTKTILGWKPMPKAMEVEV